MIDLTWATPQVIIMEQLCSQSVHFGESGSSSQKLIEGRPTYCRGKVTIFTGVTAVKFWHLLNIRLIWAEAE